MSTEKKERVVSQLTYVQQLRHLKRPVKGIVDVISRYDAVETAYLITHNGEVYTEQDEIDNPEHKAGQMKEPHIHLYVSFGKSTCRPSTLAKKLLDDPCRVSYVKGVASALLSTYAT